MKKIFSLIAAVLLATGLWADVVLEIKTIPSTKGIPASGADNAIFYTRAGGAAKSVTINSVAYLSPSECGFVFTLDSESEIKLNTLRASGTSTWTTCSLYKTPELLQELYGCAMLNNKKLSEELITWKDSADEKNAFYTALGITSSGDDNNKLLTGETNGKFDVAKDINGQDAAKTSSLGTGTTSIGTFAAGTYLLYMKMGDNNLGIANITLVPQEPACTAPENELELKADKTTSIFVGDSITFSTTGGNGMDIIIQGANEEVITAANKWEATEGEHTFRATQLPDESGVEIICGGLSEIKFTVRTKDPVVDCIIDGPDSMSFGQQYIYKAIALNATEYEWYLNDVKQGSDSVTFAFIPAAIGNYNLVCKARNEFNNDTWITSATKVIKVTKLCGLLVSATTNDEAAAGLLGGTIDTNLGKGDSKKMDRNKYWGLKFIAGTLQAGDTFAINITAAADLGNFKLFGDKEGQELIFDEGITYTKSDAAVPVICPTGVKRIILPAAATGKTALYLYRGGATAEWNVTFDSVSISRPCAASSDATIASLLINDIEMEAEGDVFSYTVPMSENLAQVTVQYLLSSTLATATPASGFTINVPAAGDPANEATITVKAEDETQKVYTVKITKAATASNDASLKSLRIDNYELTPAFASNIYEYEITIPYTAPMPTEENVHIEPNALAVDTVKSKLTIEGNVITNLIVAEDGETSLTYTVTVQRAPAKKDLLEAAFSNGAKGYIKDGAIAVPYLAGEAEPTFIAAKFWKPDSTATEKPSAAVEEGKLVVTGIDGKKDEYTLHFVAMSPASLTIEEETSLDSASIVLPGGFIYSVYGWDAEKGVKFSKDEEEANNHRISEGKDRIYIALPAARYVILTSGKGASRPVEIFINGELSSVTKTAAQGKTITLPMNNEKANFIGIESKGNNGDAGFISIKLSNSTPEGIEETEDDVKAFKVIRNGQLLIIKGEKTYNIIGVQLR